MSVPPKNKNNGASKLLTPHEFQFSLPYEKSAHDNVSPFHSHQAGTNCAGIA
jgi:hypothetical protein